MPTISVVVPVYKVEAYLHRCVDSILHQTYQDFELILVDDGSPDNCGMICDEYARTDPRIHVIHQPNGGLSAARNAGINWVFANSDSSWFTFVDSDDWVHPSMLELLLRGAEEHHTSVSVCGYGETGEETPHVDLEALNSTCVEAQWLYRYRFINATVAWGKLYHRSMFAQIRYPVGKLHEDEFVTYKLLFAAEKVAFTEAPLYAYFINPAGITKTSWSPRRLDAWEAYEQQLAFFEALEDEELVHFRYRGYLDNAMVNLRAAEAEPEKYAKQIRFMEKRIRSVIRRAWKRGCMDFWPDYDLLHQFYPVLSRVYRFWLDKIRRG